MRCRVYCAGPLFNQAERDEMARLAQTLVDAGFDVYLPHRDGMEFRLILTELTQRGYAAAQAGQFLHEAIFALDVFQLTMDCDAMVWNLNGRVPDEGAVSEAAMAWMLGKPLVAYMDDARSLIAGRTNPLLAGLVRFDTVHVMAELPARLRAEMAAQQSASQEPREFPPQVHEAIERGRRLWETMYATDAAGSNDRIAACVIELFAHNAAS